MILLIDTSQEQGIVAIAREGKVLQSENNGIGKEHASWLHPAIGRILAKEKITVRDPEAVAVVAAGHRDRSVRRVSGDCIRRERHRRFS